MKVRLNPSLHAIAALTALSSAAYADTTVLLPDCLRCTLDAAPPQGQTWITRGDFVTVGQDGLNAAGTLVNRTVRLDNPRNFTVSGQLQNETLFRNTNQLSVQDGGSVRNTGLIWNEGHVDLNGRFTNLRARVVNEGTFSGAGTFDNAKGSLFTNHGSTSLQAITNQGDIINRGTLASSVLVNHGTLQNTGSFQLAANHDLTGGTLRNTGGGTMLLSSALTLGDPKSGNVVLGQGELRLLNGAVLKNAKGHVQVNAGLIRQWDDLNVTSFVNEGTLVNSGQIVITRDFKNAGTITGKGDYRQRGTFVRGETSGSASFGKVAINGGVFKLLPGGNLQARDVSVNESYFEQSGGTLTTTDRLYNGGAYRISGEGGTINGTVRNFGRFQVQSTTAVYNGTFNNSDRYESDHAKNVFQDFILDQQGYIKASDSSFFIAGDFLNGGGDGRWNTDSSSLTLTGAGLHHMQLNGTDKGAWRDGYANNRAWSELVLGAGGSLDLTDGLPVRRNGRAALYVGEVTFEDGIGQLSNIASDYNIYYDPTLAGNAYLGGRSYAFGSGSGSLVAAAVPEPESFALVLAGLAMTTFVRRRLRPSN